MQKDDPAAKVLQRAHKLADDNELHETQAWKERHPGALAVGYMPIYAPRPLIEALGCLPVGLFGGGDQIDIVRGDSHFQSYICHIPRSTLELALAGKLDALDGLLAPAICDVIRNLGGIWQMLFPDRYVAYLDLPQNMTPALGGRFYAQELHRIADELTTRGAQGLNDERMREAIRSENWRRERLFALDSLRRLEPWRVRASEAYVIVRAGAQLTAHDHSLLIDEFLAAAKQRTARPFDNVRVVVRGAFCEQPPIDLIRALEKAGCDIVDDDFQLGLRYLSGPIDAGAEDPVLALALAYIEQGADTASRYIGNKQKGEALIAQVEELQADGVIFAAASFCDPALLDQPMLEAALDRANIPHTSFKFAENTGQFQVIREQAGAFSDAVKLWGGAA